MGQNKQALDYYSRESKVRSTDSGPQKRISVQGASSCHRARPTSAVVTRDDSIRPMPVTSYREVKSGGGILVVVSVSKLHSSPRACAAPSVQAPTLQDLTVFEYVRVAAKVLDLYTFGYHRAEQASQAPRPSGEYWAKCGTAGQVT